MRQWIWAIGLAGILFVSGVSATVPAIADAPVGEVQWGRTGICRPDDGYSRAPRRGGESDGLHYLTDVRAGGHRCYDRVVFELQPRSAGDVLGYRVEYRREPVVEDGRGRPVDMEGDAFLVVRMSPARDAKLSDSRAEPTYRGPAAVRPAGAQYVVEVRHIGTFEAVVTWAIGLRESRPFKVTALDGPSRLVVDIR